MTEPTLSDAALSLALEFHRTYELLAPSFGYKTQMATRVFDPDSPNGKLMTAVCAEILARRSGLAACRAELEAAPSLTASEKVRAQQNWSKELTLSELTQYVRGYADGQEAGRAELEAAVAAEREACAKICEETPTMIIAGSRVSADRPRWPGELAAIIRARKGAAI